MKLSIGIMVNRRESLKNWELRLIEYIFNSEFISEIFVISEKNYYRKTILKKINFSNLIFKFQEIVEKILFPEIKFKKKEQLIKKIKNSKTIEMPNCGHLIPLEEPDEFSDHIINFANNLN